MTEIAHEAAQIAAAKQDLRRRLSAVRRALSPTIVAERSRRASARLLDHPRLAGSATIALYAGLAHEGELDPSVAHAALVARGLRPLYPRIASRRPPRLAFHEVIDLDTLLPGPLGLRQPPTTTPEVVLSGIDVFIVPGVAFCRSGARLGFGAGYYDATLAAAPRAHRIGLCHPEQLVDALPETALDQRVDEILTHDLSLACAPGRSPGAPHGDPA